MNVGAGGDADDAKPGSATLRWVADHLGPILLALGILVSSVVGFAYEFFYGELDVTASELGLGSEQILLHAALGLGFAAIVVAAPLAVGVIALGPQLPLSWRRTVPALLCGAGLAAVIVLGLGGPATPLPIIVGIVLAIWIVRRIARPSAQTRTLAAWQISTVLYASALSLLGAYELVTAFFDRPEQRSQQAGLEAIAAMLALVLGAVGLRRAWSWATSFEDGEDQPKRRLVGISAEWPALGVAGVWLVALVAFSASDAAQRVRATGEPPQGFSVPLFSASMSCARVDWIEGRPPASTPPHALFFGESGGTTVLYQAGAPADGVRAGPLRLPSAKIALAPAAASACRPGSASRRRG